MFLSRKHKAVKTGVSDKVAGKIANGLLRLQTLFANKMHRLFRNSSIRKLKISLVLFCIIVGGHSIHTTYNSLNTDKAKSNLEINHIQTSKHINDAGNDYKTDNTDVSDETYWRIIKFKQHMDSLKQTSNKRYDSILHARPGLMDSVRMLEEIYQSQKIK
jgi:hypothetical protein